MRLPPGPSPAIAHPTLSRAGPGDPRRAPALTAGRGPAPPTGPAAPQAEDDARPLRVPGRVSRRRAARRGRGRRGGGAWLFGGVTGGGGVAGRSLAAEQEPPPFWCRCLGAELGRRGGRALRVPPWPRPARAAAEMRRGGARPRPRPCCR